MTRRKFTRRENGRLMTTFRVAFHLDVEDIAAILVSHVYRLHVADGLAFDSLLPLSQKSIEDVVDTDLYGHGWGEVEDDVPAAMWDDLFPRVVANVRAVYGLESA